MASLSIRFRPEAVEELRKAIEWYRSRSLDAANKLAVNVKRKLTEAAKAPHHWPLRRDGTRHIRIPSFPYVLIVCEHHETQHLIAFAHTSRRPGYWRKRLRDS